jgi:hypothetical protein
MSQNRSDLTEIELPPLSPEDRREFLKRAGRYAVGAPAAALLLQAASVPVRAQSYQPPGLTTETTIIVTTRPTTVTDTTRVTVRPSDRRLKTDILREGTLPNGLGVYSFRYTWSRKRFVGVMADEVEALMPGAVSIHRTGYKMVDYSALLA